MGRESGIGGKAEVSPQLLTKLASYLAAAIYGGETTGIRVVITDDEGNYLTSLGGGGAGGGSIVYTNAAGDFNASVSTGTNVVEILGGPPFTLEEINVMGGRMKKRDSSGNVTDLKLTNIVVASITGGYQVTLGDEITNFVDGDEIYAELIGPDKGFDRNQDVDKAIVYNQPQHNYTDPVQWSLTDVTGMQRSIISMDSYTNWNFHYVYSQTGSQTGTLKAYKSNVDSADTSSLTNWVECSTGVLGAGSIVMGGTGVYEGFVEVTGPTSPLKYMLQLDITAAGTGVDVASDFYTRKFY